MNPWTYMALSSGLGSGRFGGEVGVLRVERALVGGAGLAARLVCGEVRVIRDEIGVAQDVEHRDHGDVGDRELPGEPVLALERIVHPLEPLLALPEDRRARLGRP